MSFYFKNVDKGVCDTCKHLKQNLSNFICGKSDFIIGDNPSFTTCDLYEFVNDKKKRVNFRSVEKIEKVMK